MISQQKSDLEKAANPKEMAQHIIQGPRQTGLFTAIGFAPPLLQGRTTGTILESPCKGLYRPQKTRKQAGVDSAIVESRIPFLSGIDPLRPSGVQFFGEITCLLLRPHLPQIGGLQGSLIAQHLDQECR